MRNRMYGGVRGRKTRVGEKLHRFPPTRFITTPQKVKIFIINQKKVHFFVKFFEILTSFSSLI